MEKFAGHQLLDQPKIKNILENKKELERLISNDLNGRRTVKLKLDHDPRKSSLKDISSTKLVTQKVNCGAVYNLQYK